MFRQARSVLLAFVVTASLPPAQAQKKDTSATIRAIRGAPKPPPKRNTTRTTTRRAPNRTVTRPKPAPAAPNRDPNILTVAKTGTADARTIGDALKRARPGMRVLLQPGSYAESVTLARSVEIAAAPAAPEGSVVVSSHSGPALTIRAAGADIRGLSLRSSGEHTVVVLEGDGVIDGCNISGGTRAAVAIRGQRSEPLLKNTSIFASKGDGLLATEGARPTLENCEIGPSDGAGLRVSGGASVALRGSRIRNARAEGVRVEAGGKAAFDGGSIFANGAGGASVGAGGTLSLRRCRFRENAQRGVLVEQGASATLDGCDLVGNLGPSMETRGDTSPEIRGCKADVFAGIVSWWPLEGNADDLVGGNHGKISGNIVPEQGIVGRALRFNGESNGIAVPDAVNFKLGGSLSIAVWVNLAFVPGGQPMEVLFRGDDRGGTDPYSLWIWSGKIGFKICNTYPSLSIVEMPAVAGEWQHIAGTLDAQTGKMKIYRNGQLASELETTLRPIVDLDPAQHPGVGIGNVQYVGPHNQPFVGVMDELQLYSRALTPGEVEALANRR